MKPFLIAIFGFFTLMSCSQETPKNFQAEALSEKLLTLDNQKSVRFSDVLKASKGKVTVIEIWASWCSDCIKSMPAFKEIQTENPNVNFVYISMDKSVEKWKEGIEKHQLKGIHYWNSDGMKGPFGKAIHLDWIPRYIILDAEGNIVTYRAIEKDFDSIKSTLNKLKTP